MKLFFVFLYILIILASFLKEGTASVECNALLRSSESGCLPACSGFPFNLFQVYEAIDTRDGASCAELVSFKHPHVANPRLQVGDRQAHGV